MSRQVVCWIHPIELSDQQYELFKVAHENRLKVVYHYEIYDIAQVLPDGTFELIRDVPDE